MRDNIIAGRRPVIVSARSIQFGTAVALSLPHWLHRIRGPKDGTYWFVIPGDPTS
jgi:hypothetical protein